MPILNAARKLLKRSNRVSVPPKLVIVGLGNPGEEYASSRHNVGFWCIDRISGEHSISLSRRNRSALLGEGVIEGNPVALAKPRTFVNRSGEAATYLLARFRMSPGELLVIYADITLPLGKLRLRPGGSAGGHNGVKSITQALGTQDFPRLRVGDGAPPPGSDQIGYVLGSIPDDDMETANAAVDRVAQAVASVLTEGIDTTMNRFN